jgi:predicted oxidoreductase
VELLSGTNVSAEQHDLHIRQHSNLHVTGQLPAAKITRIKEFTPAAWAKAKEQMVAQVA